MPMDQNEFEAIIRELSEGSTVKKCLVSRGLAMWDFFEFMTQNPKNQLLYDRAQQIKSEGYAEEANEIADNATDPAKARLQVETRKWYASKIKPEKFGERLDINVNKTIDIRAAMAEGRSRMIEAQAHAEEIPADSTNKNQMLLPPRDLENVINVQAIDLSKVKHARDSGHKPVAQQMVPQNDEDDIFS